MVQCEIPKYWDICITGTYQSLIYQPILDFCIWTWVYSFVMYCMAADSVNVSLKLVGIMDYWKSQFQGYVKYINVDGITTSNLGTILTGCWWTECQLFPSCPGLQRRGIPILDGPESLLIKTKT